MEDIKANTDGLTQRVSGKQPSRVLSHKDIEDIDDLNFGLSISGE